MPTTSELLAQPHGSHQATPDATDTPQKSPLQLKPISVQRLVILMVLFGFFIAFTAWLITLRLSDWLWYYVVAAIAIDIGLGIVTVAVGLLLVRQHYKNWQ